MRYRANSGELAGMVASISARQIATLVQDGSHDPVPGYQRLADAIRMATMDGRLQLGHRLPSERALATRLGISRTTVTAAYDRLREVGFAAGEVILNSLSYHLVPAGYLFDGAFTRLGATVIPAGTGPADLQLQMARDLAATGFVGTPSFLLSLLQKAEEKGVSLSIRRAVTTGRRSCWTPG